MRGSREGLDTSAEPSPAVPWAELDFSGATCPARGRRASDLHRRDTGQPATGRASRHGAGAGGEGPKALDLSRARHDRA